MNRNNISTAYAFMFEIYTNINFSIFHSFPFQDQINLFKQTTDAAEYDAIMTTTTLMRRATNLPSLSGYHSCIEPQELAQIDDLCSQRASQSDISAVAAAAASPLPQQHPCKHCAQIHPTATALAMNRHRSNEPQQYGSTEIGEDTVAASSYSFICVSVRIKYILLICDAS